MYKTAIALLAACAGALAGSDEDYLAGFVPYAPTPQTSNLLAKAVQEAREGRYDNAADLIGQMTDSTNPALRAAVTNVMTHDGPFWLDIKAAQLRYRMCESKYSRFDLADECETLFHQYTNTMDHTYCGGILDIVLMLENFYWMNYDLRNTDAIVQEKLRFDPTGYTHEYVSWRLECGDSTQKLRAVMKQHLDAGGTMHKELSLLDCELIRREGGDAIGACMDYHTRFPNADIRPIVDIACKSLDVDRPETVEKYYKWILSLVDKQPQDDAHFEVIKHLISEQKKLEMLVPDLVPRADALTGGRVTRPDK
jgi:hypothetical protein